MLRGEGFDVVGDLALLEPADLSGLRHPSDVSDAELVDAAAQTIANMLADVRSLTRERNQLVDEVYRTESRRVFATLVRLLGDFDLAEDALHDAFTAALKQWANDGVPANPRAWLVSTGRFKAIDAIRRRARFDASLATLAASYGLQVEGTP